MDDVDKILAQWKTERPDLNNQSMGLIGRLQRLSHHLVRDMEMTFNEFGLNLSNFDVLATLRRSGPPYQLSPGELLSTMMIASGTLTNRIDQLAKSGYIKRIQNPDDGRSVFIALTNKGFDTIDAAVTAHVATQIRLTSALSPKEMHDLDHLLKNFLKNFE